MSYRQLAGTGNAQFHNEWVITALRNLPLIPSPEKRTLLDVGAGMAPYRTAITGLGYAYRSHDFSAYVPSVKSPGLQNESWRYPSHDIICDIVDIPDDASSDAVLCTEVLEHVPDPVRAFQRMAALVKPSGYLVVTVPFLSLMHQAPFWFSSGLSPFWFEFWAEDTNLDIHELTVQGDYVDLMAQEVGRLLIFKPRVKGLNHVGSAVVKRLRKRLPSSVLQSGGGSIPSSSGSSGLHVTSPMSTEVDTGHAPCGRVRSGLRVSLGSRSRAPWWSRRRGLRSRPGGSGHRSRSARTRSRPSVQWFGPAAGVLSALAAACCYRRSAVDLPAAS